MFRQIAILFILALLIGGSLISLSQVSRADQPIVVETYSTNTRYDIGGRVTGVFKTDPDGSGPQKIPATRNTYNAKGFLEKVETGTLASFQSDSIDPANWTGFSVLQITEMKYDSRGNKYEEKIKSPDGTIHALTHYKYDVYDRLWCTAVRMNPDVFATVTTNACQLGTAGAYGNDRITRNSYHYLNHLLKVEKAVGTPLRQDYATWVRRKDGQPAAVTDANNNKTEYKYDGFGRLVEIDFPSKTTHGSVNTSDNQQYGYDANDNRTSLKKRDGQTFTYSYDPLNRVKQKTTPSSMRNVYYKYDLLGAQLRARFDSYGGPGLTYTYDGFGRLKTSTNNLGINSRTLSYLYDKNGNRTRVTHPDGNYFKYDYDNVDRLYAVYENSNTALLAVGYNDWGKLSGVARSSGANTAALYDDAGRLSVLGQDLSGTTGDVNQVFTWTPSSQMRSRLTTNAAYRYSGDANHSGNYTVNGLNQYTAVDGATITHDANGNLTSDGSTSYTYDAENRLLTASGGHSATLEYDPMGRLFKITSGGSSTEFLYDGDALVAEYASNGSLLRRYVHGPEVDRPLVWYEGSAVSSTYRRMLHTNQQGSIIAVSDTSGALITANTYDVYGIPKTSNVGRFQYTGQAYLPSLGLYYYKARIYDPRLGRFLQTDPIGYEDQMNLYAYVGSDPINAVDPMGTDLVILTSSPIAPPTTLRHQAVLVGSDKHGWTYFSLDGTQKQVRTGRSDWFPGKAHYTREHFDTLKDFASSKDAGRYVENYRVKTSRSKDLVLLRIANRFITKHQIYSGPNSNCGDLAEAVASEVDEDFPDTIRPESTLPYMRKNKKRYGPIFILPQERPIHNEEEK